MTATTYSVAFRGTDAQLVEVQCALSPGLPSFAVVGLPDKAVSEAKERVRAALGRLQVALPAQKVTVNLAPADLPKSGAHFDLAIAVGLLVALDCVPAEAASGAICLGELGLDGTLAPVSGSLPAALTAASHGKSLICPRPCDGEAAWIPTAEVFGAASLRTVMDHLTRRRPLPAAMAAPPEEAPEPLCLSEVRGQGRAKRALEIAAAGRHNLFMIGPPGSGKTMLAKRLPGILPDLPAQEALAAAMVRSVAGARGGVSRRPAFCAPHHTSSGPALVGGGSTPRPGQISLAHHGVLFLDELPEFQSGVLDTLREPLETGEITLARARGSVTYPCQFMLVAAANPCRCGHLHDAGRACSQAPNCGARYMRKLSGPLLDRFDLRIEMPPVYAEELTRRAPGERSDIVAARVARARDRQIARAQELGYSGLNCDASGHVLERITEPTRDGAEMLRLAAEKFRLTARGYHRILRVARTIADLDDSDRLDAKHIGEALALRSDS